MKEMCGMRSRDHMTVQNGIGMKKWAVQIGATSDLTVVEADAGKCCEIGNERHMKNWPNKKFYHRQTRIGLSIC